MAHNTLKTVKTVKTVKTAATQPPPTTAFSAKIDTEPDIVQICIYYNHNTASSFIGLPVKTRQEKSATTPTFTCPTLPDMEPRGSFYAVNADFRPIPPGMSLICMKDDLDGELETVYVEQVYDQYNVDETGCTRFLAWLEPLPQTVPLHVFKKGSKYLITLDSSEKKQAASADYKELWFSPIYVLSIPDVKFHGQFGRCIPGPSSSESDVSSLKDCIYLHGKNVSDLSLVNTEPGLMHYLDKMYAPSQQQQGSSTLPVAVIILLVVCLVLFIFGLMWVYFKK